jgi:hypothetical protein
MWTNAGMDHQTSQMFSYLSPEMMVPQEHPLRVIRPAANASIACRRLSARCIRRSGGPRSRPSNCFGRCWFRGFFPVRSERQLKEQLAYTLLTR